MDCCTLSTVQMTAPHQYWPGFAGSLNVFKSWSSLANDNWFQFFGAGKYLHFKLFWTPIVTVGRICSCMAYSMLFSSNSTWWQPSALHRGDYLTYEIQIGLRIIDWFSVCKSFWTVPLSFTPRLNVLSGAYFQIHSQFLFCSAILEKFSRFTVNSTIILNEQRCTLAN